MESEESAKERPLKTEEIVFLTFIGLVCFCSCIYNSFCKKKPDQENLETTERQDQVIKTYQIAKMIISGTAFESLQLTVLQTSITETRLHFVCIYEYIVMRCKLQLVTNQGDPSTYTGYKTILAGDADE